MKYYVVNENDVEVSENRICVDLLNEEIRGIFECMKENGLNWNDFKLLESMYEVREFIRDCSDDIIK